MSTTEEVLKKWVAALGHGRFTCGAKYVCFLPKGKDLYIPIAQAPEGEEDSVKWGKFADALVDFLNLQKPVPPSRDA